jgi:hypothetical protein
MPELRSMEEAAKSTQLTPAQIAAIQGAPTGEIMTNTPVFPSLDDEVTGIGGGSNIAVRPNPDGTTTLTAPDGRLAVVDMGQDLDEAIKVFDEVVTPIDAQTETLRLQAQEEALGAPDFTSTPFTSVRTGGISTLGTPSVVGTAPAVDTSSESRPAVMDVSPAQQAINYGAIQAQEAAYTAAKGATGDDAKAEAAGQAAYNNFLRTASDMPVASTVDTSTTVDTSSGTATPAAGTGSLDAAASSNFTEVSDAEAVANAEAIKAQEVAYTETKAETGSDSAAEAAAEAAYTASVAAASSSKKTGDSKTADTTTVIENADGSAEVVTVDAQAATDAAIADNLFEAANQTNQDVVTVNADGTATVAVDPNAVVTGTDLAVANDGTTGITTNADGTTDVVVDGTTDLTTAATTDLTVGGDTDTDTNTTAVTVFDDAIEGTATEISGVLTDQTTDTDTKTKTVVVPAVDTKVLTEVEPPEEEVIIEEEVVTADPDRDPDPEVPDIFVPVITSTDEDGNTITECPEGYKMMETEDGPMCQKTITVRSSRQRAGAGTRAYTGLAGNRGRSGPGQKRKTTTSSTYERVAPTTTSA